MNNNTTDMVPFSGTNNTPYLTNQDNMLVPVNQNNNWNISINPQQLQAYGRTIVRSTQGMLQDKDKCKSLAVGTAGAVGVWFLTSWTWPMIGLGAVGHTCYKVAHNYILQKKPIVDEENQLTQPKPKSIWDGTIVQSIFGWGKKESNNNNLQNTYQHPQTPNYNFMQPVEEGKDFNSEDFQVIEQSNTNQNNKQNQFVEIPLDNHNSSSFFRYPSINQNQQNSNIYQQPTNNPFQQPNQFQPTNNPFQTINTQYPGNNSNFNPFPSNFSKKN